MRSDAPLIEVRDLEIRFGDKLVHQHVNLTVEKGEVLGIVGGSGSGKTTLMREMLALTRPTSGSIRLFGHDILDISPVMLLKIQQQFGVLFQQNALFSSLSLLENVSFPLHEHTDLDDETIRELALLKINLAGLSSDAALLYPSELSGGMQKRAGLARAMVLDPALLFLDEPTAGLDPNTADAFDELILNLQRTMGLTIVIVTHDLDTLWKVTNRVAFLGEQTVLAVESMSRLASNPNPVIRGFFSGSRGRSAQDSYQQGQGKDGS